MTSETMRTVGPALVPDDAGALELGMREHAERGRRVSGWAELGAHLDSLGAADARARRELAEVVRTGFSAGLRHLTAPELPERVEPACSLRVRRWR